MVLMISAEENLGLLLNLQITINKQISFNILYDYTHDVAAL